MPVVSLKAVVGPRSSSHAALQALCATLGEGVTITDSQGKALVGGHGAAYSLSAIPVVYESTQLGTVSGSGPSAEAIALLVTHLAAREAEGRAMAAEVLHLYREIHLIEELSEQLAPLLDTEDIARAAIDQAQRLIVATHGGVLCREKEGEPLRVIVRFGPEDDLQTSSALEPQSPFMASILERGTAEILNDGADTRLPGATPAGWPMIGAPLRIGGKILGVIALSQRERGSHYSSADLKLLNTISLQTATAIEKARLFSDMVSTERQRAEYAAELKAASAVQQLLLQGASQPTPGFQVESVYLPATEAGGDFFFVQPARNGALIAIVGDVSGKGLTAAMRVAMILGVLRRETSEDPAEILFHLNNALIAQGQLGFTTACCVRIAATGEFTLANAGHIAPYLSGEEVAAAPALPLGLVANASYAEVQGKLPCRQRLVLMSDGVPEARSSSGQLLGFDRLPELSQLNAAAIADAACQFGQEDDITVVTIAQLP